MSVLIVGLSHQSAPLELLERLALGAEQSRELAEQVLIGEHISEVLVLATCNRVEVVAEVEAFHGALAEIGARLARVGGVSVEELSEHLYVHYDERAVGHLFSVACGLDSMAVGESQILGQVREALAVGQRAGHLGPGLNPLLQHALRIGKRAHAETAIDRVAASLVDLGLERAATVLPELRSVRAVLIGAGAMSGLAAATVARHGIGELVVVNRTRRRAERLAELHGGRAADWDELPDLLGSTELVISCTGAVGALITREQVTQARDSDAPLVLLDLAMPRDVEPAVGDLPGVHLWGLAALQHDLHSPDRGEPDAMVEDAVAAVRDVVTAEVGIYLSARRAQQVGPTLAALRARAAAVVESEYERLVQRRPEWDESTRAEVHRTVARVADKLLHTPTVRVKELASADDPGDYTHALSTLFDLDPREIATVERPPYGTTEVPR